MARKYDVLVVGSGLAGATAARLMAEKGRSVLVLEKNSHIGGNCYDEMTTEGITIQRFGPHVFHTDSQMVWNFVNRFSPFRIYQHRVLSYVDGQLLPFPINRDTLSQLYGIDLDIRQVDGFLAAEIARSTFQNPPANLRDAIVSQVGELLYAKFFQRYSLKQWGADPTELSAELAGRIAVRANRDARRFTSHYQGVPERGFTALMDGLLNHPLIDLQLQSNYFDERIELDRPGRFDLCIYTGKLDDYFAGNFCRQLRALELSFRPL